MIEIDKFITINGVQITEKSDFEIKYQLLTKKWSNCYKKS